MVSLLQSYEQQYVNLTSEICAQTDKVPILSGAEKKTLSNQIEKHIEEVHELLEQMDLEICTLPATERQKYQTNLKNHKAEVAQLEKELRKAQIAYKDNIREELLGGDDYYVAEEQKQRLLDNTERLERSSHRLETGYKIAVETEHIGAEILNDLHSQRETIHRARNRLRETDDDINKSSRVLTSMLRRAMQNRIILAVLMIIILSVIIATIYLVASR